MLRVCALLLFSASICSAQTIDAPDSAVAGGELTVGIAGSKNPRDFVSVVLQGSREGAYDAYKYATGSQVKLAVPAIAGEYEIRLLGADSPYPTLARRAIRLQSATATLDAPAQVAAGTRFAVKWTGPNNARDYVGIGDIDPKKRAYISYVYTSQGSPITLTAPDQGGEYELRYFLGNGDAVVTSKRITVGTVAASITAPTQIGAGAKFKVNWQGPNNPRDFITLVKAGTPEKRYDSYAYTSNGNPVELRAPDQAGEYEIRYASAQTYTTLARAPIKVTVITASLQGPADAVAGSSLAVTWKGPNNPQDYITLVPSGAKEGVSGNYGYTATGNPAKLLAPLSAGEYELRYSTGQSHSTLAAVPIRILQAKEAPGFVTASMADTAAAGRAVEIILDASGSMLQRIGAHRRIDIAKQTLSKLTSSVLPAGTPFALRVFGKEIDSCQTDLEIPLAPLNAATVTAKIGALEAKNNAKTPIGASLEAVAKDLSAAKERVVIVLTDGEETCGGDPAAAIEKLRKSSAPTRVSIVGFAIDDAKLAASFRHWSTLGDGMYFDAKDADGLSRALTQALQPAFEIVNAQDIVVAEGLAGGEPLRVAPGTYKARVKGTGSRAQSVVVKAQETTAVKL
jgi:hypothetical protein